MRTKLLAIPLLLFCHAYALAQNTIIDSLQNIVALNRNDTTELNALLSLSNEFLRKDFKKSTYYAHEAIVLARTQQNNLKLANGYQYLITLSQNSGRMDSSGYYLDLLEALSKNNPSTEKLQISYNQSAGLFYKNQGQYRKALPFMEANLLLLTTENEGRAGQLLNIGNTYNSLGDFKNAVYYHLQALSLFEKLKNERGQSFCLQSLGNDLLELAQFQQAKTYYQKSINLKEKLQDTRGIITSSIGLGDVSKELLQYDLSEKYYKQAVQISVDMKVKLEELRSRYKLGLLYKQKEDFSRALEHISKSLQLARDIGDSTMSAKIKSEIIGLNSEKRTSKATEATLLANINTLINAGNKSGVIIEYERLSNYYLERNQFDKAFFYLKKHEQLKDSVEGITVLFQIKELESRYENDKKEKEIELLKKDQELQSLALSKERTHVTLIAFALLSVVIISFLLINRYRIMNRSRRELELEKVRNHIARDLHDDIGSTLSSINIMSQLAMNGNAQEHLKKITLHSSRMMENMSDIVWSINPKNDSLEQVVLKMKEFAFEILEPKEITPTFHIDTHLAQLKLDVTKRKNLFLIFKEAINNAAKYSGGSSVSISLFTMPHKIELSIVDNGKGFDESAIKRGNGLINMKERAASIGGEISQSSTPGKGTTLHLAIPIT